MQSVYRIGGLTQLFIVWTFLIEAGDRDWDDPVTNFVPELAVAAKESNAARDPLKYVNWDEALLGDLASHMFRHWKRL